MKGHFCGVSHVRLSDNGRRAVTYSSSGVDPNVWMWDITKGHVLLYCTLIGSNLYYLLLQKKTVLQSKSYLLL